MSNTATKKKVSQKPLEQMTAAELSKATAMYDQEFYAMDRAKPLSAEEKKTVSEARRRGRPQVGEGAARVLISIEGQLLKSADRYAKLHKLKRSELFVKGVRTVMGLASNDDQKTDDDDRKRPSRRRVRKAA